MNTFMILNIVVWILNPPGGIGKTFYAQVLEAISKMLCRDLLLASQDRGNHAIRDAMKNAAVISANVSPQDVTRIISRAQNHEFFVIDVGANPASDDYNPLPFAVEMDRQMQAKGGRFITVVPTAPLKLGGARTTMSTVSDLLNEGIETHVVKNHQNQSGDFGDLPLPSSVPVSDLPYLPSGLLALLRNRKGSFLDAYTHPEPGFALAGNRIGHYLARSSDSPLMHNLFGHTGKAFQLNPGQHPPELLSTINTLESVKDENLLENAAMKVAHEAMIAAADDDALLAAAKEYVAFFR
jgi:hypothetical protein